MGNRFGSMTIGKGCPCKQCRDNIKADESRYWDNDAVYGPMCFSCATARGYVPSVEEATPRKVSAPTQASDETIQAFINELKAELRALQERYDIKCQQLEDKYTWMDRRVRELEPLDVQPILGADGEVDWGATTRRNIARDKAKRESTPEPNVFIGLAEWRESR